MDVIFIMLAMLLALIVVLGAGVWIFVGLFIVSAVSLVVMADFSVDRVGLIFRTIVWRSSSSWELAAIPLFIWMGEMIFRSDISDRLFKGLSPLVQWMPGRLLHTNILGCTIFAAVSGSTAATTATVGKITTTELAARKYNNSLAIGSLAGAGSLGLLIPPSIVMIIYGVLAEVSIAKLFAAGLLPGLLVAFVYSSYIIIRCAINPELAPSTNQKVSFSSLAGSVVNLTPVLVLITLVLGGIYTGVVTPSEAAGLGVLSALVIVFLTKQLTFSLVFDSAMGAIKTSCMVCSILMAAAVLSTTIGYLHIPIQLGDFIKELALSPYGLLLILAFFYIVLGFFLDGISIVVMSLPITLPLIIQAGFDPIWFGVFIVLMVELAMMTPPVGFNLFVIQGMTGQSLGTVVKAAFPFFLLMCLVVVIIAMFPNIALVIPNMM